MPRHSDAIREAIREAGMTVSGLAREIQVNRPNLQNVIAGRLPLSISIAAQIDAATSDDGCDFARARQWLRWQLDDAIDSDWFVKDWRASGD